jgi:hypothetical protein
LNVHNPITPCLCSLHNNVYIQPVRKTRVQRKILVAKDHCHLVLAVARWQWIVDIRDCIQQWFHLEQCLDAKRGRVHCVVDLVGEGV